MMHLAVHASLARHNRFDDPGLWSLDRAGEDNPQVRDGLQLSINAIATALRNSG